MKKLIFIFLIANLIMGNEIKAANLTSADLANESVLTSNIEKAQVEGMPIGSIVIWNYSGNPDEGIWLDCDGRTISAAQYPEYAASFGTKLPNFSGLFLRGHGTNADGGSSAGLNSVQSGTSGNAIPPHRHKATGKTFNITSGSAPAFSASENQGDAYYYSGLPQSITGIAGIKGENRPDNKTARYLIKVE